MAKKKNLHRGSKFEDYLDEQGLLQEATLTATKRVLAWRIAMLMKRQRVTKSALDRLLDAGNTSVTLQTMGSAAAALGQQLTISLKDAA